MNWSAVAPTTKWLVATLTGAVGLLVMLLTGDRSHVTDPEVIAIGTFLVQRIAAWVVPNSATDAGRQLARASKD